MKTRKAACPACLPNVLADFVKGKNGGPPECDLCFGTQEVVVVLRKPDIQYQHRKNSDGDPEVVLYANTPKGGEWFAKQLTSNVADSGLHCTPDFANRNLAFARADGLCVGEYKEGQGADELEEEDEASLQGRTLQSVLEDALDDWLTDNGHDLDKEAFDALAETFERVEESVHGSLGLNAEDDEEEEDAADMPALTDMVGKTIREATLIAGQRGYGFDSYKAYEPGPNEPGERKESHERDPNTEWVIVRLGVDDRVAEIIG